MVEIMYWLMFLACVSVLVMAVFVLFYQRHVNIDLKRKYNDLTRELNSCFGWEDWEWAHNFREYARKIEKLIKFKEEIERLEVIKKAIEVQKLSDLNHRKEQVEQEIKKLEEK